MAMAGIMSVKNQELDMSIIVFPLLCQNYDYRQKRCTHTDDEKLQLVRNLWEFILQAVTLFPPDYNKVFKKCITVIA